MGVDKHRADAPRSVSAYVVTLSDTRDASHDRSGGLIRDALLGAGHRVVGWCILREDPDALTAGLGAVLDQSGYDVVIVNGGTGIAPRDRAYEVLSRLYDTPLPGFGELFRSLSYAEIGSAAMLSRASAGVSRGKLVFSLPGSSGAVRLALDRLILPELGHLLGELHKPAGSERAP